MPTSVRLDPKTETVVRRLAQQTKRTKSEVIREAIARMAEQVGGQPGRGTPYAAIEDLLGIAGGGPRDLARRSDEAFRDLLVRRRPAR
jgi:Arc/MetJ-type ribon-helix-helix transcriptional regulator